MCGGIREIPPNWGACAICLRKFRANANCDWGDLIETVNVIRAHDVDSPLDPARAPDPRIGRLPPTIEKAEKIRIL